MNKLDDIRKKYHMFFAKRFYFQCGDGWSNIIQCLMVAITYHIKDEYYRDKKLPYDQWELINPEEYSFTINQVKEKFGSLRFYYSVRKDNEIFSAMVRMAELLSEFTCEETGDAGNLYVKNGFLRILSPAKAEELGYTPAKPLSVDVNSTLTVSKLGDKVLNVKG